MNAVAVTCSCSGWAANCRGPHPNTYHAMFGSDPCPCPCHVEPAAAPPPRAQAPIPAVVEDLRPLHERLSARRRLQAKADQDSWRLASLALASLAKVTVHLHPFGRREGAERDLRALTELLDRLAPSRGRGDMPTEVPIDITRRLELLLADPVRAQLRADAARLRAGAPLAPELLDGLADLLDLLADGPDVERDADDTVLLRDALDAEADVAAAEAASPTRTEPS